MHIVQRRIQVCYSLFFFFQAEDGIRDSSVTGSDVCSSDLSPQLNRSLPFPEGGGFPRPRFRDLPPREYCASRDRKSVLSGTSVDLGGRRIIKKREGVVEVSVF